MTRFQSAIFAALWLLGSANSSATPVVLQQPTATFSQDAGQTTGFDIWKAIDTDPVNTGWALQGRGIRDGQGILQIAVFETSTDIFEIGGGTLTFSLSQLYGGYHELGRFRLSVTTDNRNNFADGLATGGEVSALWVILDPDSYSSISGAILTKQPDDSILASGYLPESDVYTVTARTTLAGITGIRLEAIPDPSFPPIPQYFESIGPYTSGRQPINGNFVLTNFSVDAVWAAPEPATLGLFALGLAALGFSRFKVTDGQMAGRLK